MLDVGVLVETLETATFWSRLRAVYDAVSAALRGSLGELGDRAVPRLARLRDRRLALLHGRGAPRATTRSAGGWRRRRPRWTRSSAAGATITHHHAVGTDHQPWLEAEIGPVGVEVLRAVKAAVDPDGILNPGVLVP